MIQCAVAPPSHEWLKILVAAVVGLLSGLIADPIRGALQWRINLARMEKAIGLDIVIAIMGLENAKHGVVSWQNLWAGLQLAAYDYYWEKNREFFYGDLEIQTLHMRCATINRLIQAVASRQLTIDKANIQLEETALAVMNEEPPKGWRRRLGRNIINFVVR